MPNVSEFKLNTQTGQVDVEYSNGVNVSKDLTQAITGVYNTSTGQTVLDDASRAALVKSGVATSVPSRKAAQADAQKGALIQAPAWSTFASAAVVQYTICRHSNGELLWCVTAGTAGAAEPTFSATAAIADNTVTWVPLGVRTKLNNDGYPVPTVTATTTITGLTPTLLYSNQNKVLSLTCPFWLDSSGVTSKAYAFNDGGASDAQGLGVGLRGYNRVTEFRTDAPKFAIGHWNLPGNRFRIYVDGYLLEENPTVTIVGNPAYIVVDFNGVRATRTVRVEQPASTNLRSIAIDSQSQFFPAKQSGPIGVWLSDSYGGTISSYSDQAPDYLSERMARRLGIKYLRNYHLGGTGYVAPGTTSKVGDVLALNPPADGANVGYVLFAHGYNDTALSQSTIAANALAAWQLARQQYPNAFILVFGPWVGSGGPSANTLTTDTTLQSTYQSWGDQKSAFVSIAQDATGAWISGTGKWGALTGTGNSDFYTGADGVHPSAPGKEYLIRRIVEVSDAVLTANGY